MYSYNQNKLEETIADCTEAIKLDYRWVRCCICVSLTSYLLFLRYVKARLCRAKVHEQKGDVKLAYDDYKRALSYEPNNTQARRCEAAWSCLGGLIFTLIKFIQWYGSPSGSYRQARGGKAHRNHHSRCEIDRTYPNFYSTQFFLQFLLAWV